MRCKTNPHIDLFHFHPGQYADSLRITHTYRTSLLFERVHYPVFGITTRSKSK